MPAVVVRTLKHEFRLVAANQAVADSLAFMAIEPEIAGPALEPLALPVETAGMFLRVALPGGERAEGTPAHVISRLHGAILADVVASEGHAPLIHGALIRRDGRRFALVGDKGCGKSSLALYLLARGFAVEGDEHIVVRDTGVIARPRTLRVKSGSLPLVPDLAEAVRRSPAIANWDGTPIYAFAPSAAGFPWRIAEGALDGLVFLEANHGGRSVMTGLAKEEAFRRLLDQAIMPAAGVGAAVARLRTLLAQVRTFRLQVGDLPRAAWHLGRMPA